MSFDDAPEVPLPKSPGLDERDGETDARGMCRDSRPDDPAADDEHVELPRRELLHRAGARIVHARMAARARPGWIARPMSPPALALALGSAFLHAFWNLLLARAPDIEATTAVALVTGIVVFAPVAVTRLGSARGVWPFLAVTSLLQLAYFVAA